jgi:predicted transcriptional regulator of viral defense system
MDFKDLARKFNKAPLNRQVMLDVLKEYKRPNDKISELIKSGELIPLKKGLYITQTNAEISGPEPFLIANHLWGPSYVSLESALSYWGLIPERVYETSSVTIKLSKKYKTPVGRYSYRTMPWPYYSYGIKSIELSDRQTVLIASPEKALCDKIITTARLALRGTAQTLVFLTDDLRIEAESLKKLNLKDIRSWAKDAPKRQSLLMLVKTLEKL